MKRLLALFALLSPASAFAAPAETAERMHISGDLMFVSGLESGLDVLNISDRRSPWQMTRIHFEGKTYSSALVENTGYVLTDAGLNSLDLANVYSPLPLETLSEVHGQAMIVRDNRAYIVGPDAFYTVQLDRATMTLLGSAPIAHDGFSPQLAIENGIAYVGTGFATYIFDVNGNAPMLLATIDVGGDWGLTAKDGIVYASNGGRIAVIDARIPNAATLIDSVSIPASPIGDIVVAGNSLIISNSIQLARMDLSNPLRPTFAGVFAEGGPYSPDLMQVGNLLYNLYLADDNSHLFLVRVLEVP